VGAKEGVVVAVAVVAAVAVAAEQGLGPEVG
jgi:hypothetical protein